MNLKNAKDVKEKIAEIKKKNTKFEKKSQKSVKKMTKKEKEKINKFNKFMKRFILVEYVILAGVLLVTNNLELVRQNRAKDLIIENQEQTIINLTQANINISNLNTTKEDLQVENAYLLTKSKTIKLSAEDRELIAKLLYHEARGEGIECQKAIVSVIINRLNSGKWGKTIRDVIYADGQFEPVGKGLLANTKPLNTQYQAIDYVCENGITLPSWVLYFRASYHFNWKGYTQYCKLSNTFFGGYEK